MYYITYYVLYLCNPTNTSTDTHTNNIFRQLNAETEDFYFNKNNINTISIYMRKKYVYVLSILLFLDLYFVYY